MKSTGIVRKIDDLGRVVLPIELRRTLNMKSDDAVEIFTDEEFVILKKYAPSCLFCGEARNVIDHKGKKICPTCLTELKQSV